LLWFPVLTSCALIVLVMVAFAIAGLGQVLGPAPFSELPTPWSLWADPPEPGAVARRSVLVGGPVLLLGSQLVATAGAVALTHAALESLAGRAWTFGGALARLRERRGKVVGYAILQATVGGWLARRRRGREGVGRVGRKLVGTAWWAATYLAIPVITREGKGPLEAVERSTRLLRGTWKETFLGRLGIGWVWSVAGLGSALLVALVLVAGGRPSPLVVVLLPALLLGGVGLLLHTLDVIYRAALYTFATEGVIPEPFDAEELQEIWRTA
jgi:hypothetical protein